MRGLIFIIIFCFASGCIELSDLREPGAPQPPCNEYDVRGFYTLTKVLYRDKEEGEFYYEAYNAPEQFAGYLLLGEENYEMGIRFSMIIDTYKDPLEVNLEKSGTYSIEWTGDGTFGSVKMSPPVSEFWTMSATRCKSLTFYINDSSEADYYLILKWFQY